MGRKQLVTAGDLKKGECYTAGAREILECTTGHVHNLVSQEKLKPARRKGNGRLIFRVSDVWAYRRTVRGEIDA